jgi:hypothetical protein
MNLEFVKTKTSSFHAPVLLRQYVIQSMDAEEMEGYLKAFSPEVAASKLLLIWLKE